MSFWLIVSGTFFLLLASVDEANCGLIRRLNADGKHLSDPSTSSGVQLNTMSDAYGSDQIMSQEGRKLYQTQGTMMKNKAAQATLAKNDQINTRRNVRKLSTPDDAGFKYTNGAHSLLQSNVVAFTVANDGPDQGNYNESRIITFNRVITNIGGRFDTNTSVFTCNVSGLYFFSVSLSSTVSFLIGVEAFLALNGTKIIDISNNSRNSAAMSSVYLPLKAGDQVSVMLTPYFAVFGHWSSFSGSLIQPFPFA